MFRFASVARPDLPLLKLDPHVCRPIDETCDCLVCRRYNRAYLHTVCCPFHVSSFSRWTAMFIHLFDSSTAGGPCCDAPGRLIGRRRRISSGRGRFCAPASRGAEDRHPLLSLRQVVCRSLPFACNLVTLHNLTYMARLGREVRVWLVHTRVSSSCVPYGAPSTLLTTVPP